MADSLVTLSKNLTSPATMKGSDFKAATPAVGSGEEGNNQLLKQSSAQSSPRSVTGSDFKTEKNSGETGTSLSTGVSVDLGTGKHSCPDQK